MSAPMVFIHGWAQSKRIWHRQAQVFPGASFINLPGHGGEPEAVDWLAALEKRLPEKPVILVGWSLGGMLAMQTALKRPERIAGLVLVATTPRFCNGNGWQQGSSEEVFRGFEQGVREKSGRTLGRFFALMMQGDPITRSEYNDIARESVDREHPPSVATLERGLEYLEGIDLTGSVADLDTPALLLHGDQDAIVPIAAGEWLADALPNARFHRFDRCGHAPFLTQTEKFNRELEAWCHRI